MAGQKTVNPEALSAVDPQKEIILDVRTPMEHAEKHLTLPHAHEPLDGLRPTEFMCRKGLDKGAGVYILCRSGKRAAQAAEKFRAEGFDNVHVVEGGLVACEACGQKMEGHAASSCPKGAKGPLPLERQVRIAAGSLAFAGAALGLAVHPLFTLVPLFVGAGLVFAGVTDRCGMALLLTRAPWNK